jgi:hypothetical protein
MHYCHMTEDHILYSLPVVRGYQYIHAALLSQGVRCVRPSERHREFDCLMDSHDSILQAYHEPEYDE